MDVVREKWCGLWSCFIFKCRMCNVEMPLWSEKIQRKWTLLLLKRLGLQRKKGEVDSEGIPTIMVVVAIAGPNVLFRRNQLHCMVWSGMYLIAHAGSGFEKETQDAPVARLEES
ncbi:hypothetical protein PR048_004681 [Dryococelus australis]|uniref:Uncharacterized protein n=1 Tax=Dryococelus australis TaxID=614101 RepID=A0ABQ9I6W0_9NEOP|nr:hypothetical protein PR048_004681 [Dryococelus australis]